MLTGKKILLRSLEKNDLDFLFNLENNHDTSYLHENLSGYSRSLLKEYIKNAKQDFFISGQFRFLIENNTIPLGVIDLFNFNIDDMSAYIGIIILDKYRQQGYASEALDILINYAWKSLFLRRLYCTISNDNTKSIKLFTNANFEYEKSLQGDVRLYMLKR
tara:strand:- start:55 stop:537 length:483 start_codon:yes stop_codon:yes gene_type:complete